MLSVLSTYNNVALVVQESSAHMGDVDYFLLQSLVNEYSAYGDYDDFEDFI